MPKNPPEPPLVVAPALPDKPLYGTMPCQARGCDATANVYDFGDGKYVGAHVAPNGRYLHEYNFGAALLPLVRKSS